MNNQAEKRQIIGVIILIFTAGLPGAMMAGFFAPWPWGMESALCLAAAGGLVGGALMAPRLFWAGAIAGLIAGPMGLAALYLYARWRDQLWSAELVLIQGLASLPGLAFYFLAAFWFPPDRDGDITRDGDNESFHDNGAIHD